MKQPSGLDMAFAQKLSGLRKQKGLTQKVLAEEVGVCAIQIRRYESETSQPTLDVIKKIAIVLGVSADELLFDRDERGPDEDLKLHFEAISRMTKEEREVVKSVLEGLILKHDANKWRPEAGKVGQR